MFKYVCMDCGSEGFSSAELPNMKNPTCTECGGRLVEGEAVEDYEAVESAAIGGDVNGKQSAARVSYL